MVYRSGQFEVIYPFLEGVTPEWLLLGGPADGDEAQCAVKKWPDIGVVGVEPNLDMWEYQYPIWPKKGVLHRLALSDHFGEAKIYIPSNPRATSLNPDRRGNEEKTLCLTVDAIVAANQMSNAILWLDIEGWEYQALLGARKSFDEGRILLINLEVMDREEEKGIKIDEFMKEVGFELVHKWSSDRDSHPHWDKIYRLKHRTWYLN